MSTKMGRKSLFALDNLWDGLGALTVENPGMEYFFGKVTMYTSFNIEYQCLASLGYSHAWSLWALINNTTYHRKRKSQSLRPQLSEGLDFPGDPHAQRKPGNEGCQGGLLP